MIVNKRLNCVWFFILVLLKIRLNNAEKVIDTNVNQDSKPSSVDSRFFDPSGRGMGYPNMQGPGPFGNLPNNYPGNSFLPYGNQNVNRQPPRQDFGWNPNAQNPNQLYPQGRPYQPQGNYPGNQGNFPYGQGPIGSRPNNPNGYYNPGQNMNQNPEYQGPSYSNMPGDGTVYPINVNRPYQNQGMPNQGGYPNQQIQSNQYPPQNGQYPAQGNFQGNQNFLPRPDDIINFPGNNANQPQANQYPSQNGIAGGRPNQNTNFSPYPPNNIPVNNAQQYPGNPGNPDFNVGTSQFPNQSTINQGSNSANPNQVLPGNFNSIQTRPQLPNNQQTVSINGPNANDTAAILGKPVFVPSSTASPGQVPAGSTSESPAQKRCVQNCPSTPEYNPVCGTNNVTYINPGRFYCARNCGENISILNKGRCVGDIPPV